MKYKLHNDCIDLPNGARTEFNWVPYKNLKKGYLYVDNDGDVFIYLKEGPPPSHVPIGSQEKEYNIYYFYDVLNSKIIWAHPHQTIGKERIEIVKYYDL